MMDESDAIFASTIPNTGKMHINVREQDDSRALKTLKLHSDGRVEVEMGDEEMSTTARFRLGVQSLKPVTTSNLHWSGDELCMSVSAACPEPGQDPAVSAFLRDVRDGLRLRCGFCGNDIAGLGSVHRVRPFPKATDGFFCHAEDGAHLVGDVLPTEACFDGSSLILNRVLVAADRLQESKGGERLCARCGESLGRQDSDHLRLLIASLDVELEELDVDGDPIGLTQRKLVPDESALLHLLVFGLTLNDDTRVVVHSSDGDKAALFLLWVVEQPGLLFHSGWPAADEESIPGVWSRKLLYRPLLSDTSDIGKAWQRDISVASLHLPERRGLELLRLLAESSLRLPASMRRVSDFYVALLSSNA